MSDAIWSVYGLIDPRGRSVFYVGCSAKVPYRVVQHHSDPASSAYHVCQTIRSSGFKVEYCIFGSFLDKLPAKILEGRLILAMPSVVNNKKSYHGLPSSTLYPDWQDLRVTH